MSFGERLKELRLKKNVTQQQIGDYIGVGRTTIAGYETKDKHPDFDKLRAIATFFNVTTDYLLEIDEKENKNSSNEITMATHRIDAGEDLPEEALAELDEYILYLKYKYKNSKKED